MHVSMSKCVDLYVTTYVVCLFYQSIQATDNTFYFTINYNEMINYLKKKNISLLCKGDGVHH